jgi:hypothetical protein
MREKTGPRWGLVPLPVARGIADGLEGLGGGRPHSKNFQGVSTSDRFHRTTYYTAH